MPARVSRLRSTAAARGFIALTLVLLGATPASAQPTPSLHPAESDLAAALETLRNRSAPGEDRRDAAAQLLATDDPAIRAMLHRAAFEDRPPGAARAICDALPLVDPPPAYIATALTTTLRDAPPDQLAWRLPALAPFHSRAAVGAVVSVLQRDPPVSEALRTTACRVLIEQTALAHLGENPGAWLGWWNDHAALGPIEWYRTISEAQASRARALGDDRDRLVADVERLYREVHALTPVGERSPLIASLIRSERPMVAAIGFDLAKRALLNARPLGQEVVDAGLARLNDPNVTIRREAASLLDRIDPPDLAGRAADALLSETDPDAAASLLRILSRQPDPRIETSLAQWATTPGPARGPALAAAVTLIHTGCLADPEVRTPIEDAAVADIIHEHPTVGGVRFLDACGRLERFPRLLTIDNREVAIAAAEALAASDGRFRDVFSAARKHADLFAAATSAVATHLTTANGLRTLLSLPAPNDDERRRAASRVSAMLAPDELLRVARTIDDPHLATACLAHVPQPEFMTRPDHDEQRQELLLRYLNARLDAEDPESALQAIAGVQDAIDTAPYAAPRVTALLRLGRLDDAEKVVGAPEVAPGVWIDALEHGADLPFAADLAARIRRRFADRLTEPQRQRLETIENRLGSPTGAADPSATDPGEAGRPRTASTASS